VWLVEDDEWHVRVDRLWSSRQRCGCSIKRARGVYLPACSRGHFRLSGVQPGLKSRRHFSGGLSTRFRDQFRSGSQFVNVDQDEVASSEVVYGGPDVGRVVNVETVTA
jgi:hypothetical protein